MASSNSWRSSLLKSGISSEKKMCSFWILAASSDCSGIGPSSSSLLVWSILRISMTLMQSGLPGTMRMMVPFNALA